MRGDLPVIPTVRLFHPSGLGSLADASGWDGMRWKGGVRTLRSLCYLLFQYRDPVIPSPLSSQEMRGDLPVIPTVRLFHPSGLGSLADASGWDGMRWKGGVRTLRSLCYLLFQYRDPVDPVIPSPLSSQEMQGDSPVIPTVRLFQPSGLGSLADASGWDGMRWKGGVRTLRSLCYLLFQYRDPVIRPLCLLKKCGATCL